MSVKPARLPAVFPAELWDKIFGHMLHNVAVQRRQGYRNVRPQTFDNFIAMRRVCGMFNNRVVQLMFKTLDLSEHEGFSTFHFSAIILTSKRSLVQHIRMQATRTASPYSQARFYGAPSQLLTSLVGPIPGLRAISTFEHPQATPTPFFLNRCQQELFKVQMTISNCNILKVCSTTLKRLELHASSLDLSATGRLVLLGVTHYGLILEDMENDDCAQLLKLCPNVESLELLGTVQDRPVIDNLDPRNLLPTVGEHYSYLRDLNSRITALDARFQPMTDFGHYFHFKGLKSLHIGESELFNYPSFNEQGQLVLPLLPDILPESLRTLVVTEGQHVLRFDVIPSMNDQYKSLVGHTTHPDMALVTVTRESRLKSHLRHPWPVDWNSIHSELDDVALVVTSLTSLQLSKKERDHVKTAWQYREDVLAAYEENWHGWETAAYYNAHGTFVGMAEMYDGVYEDWEAQNIFAVFAGMCGLRDVVEVEEVPGKGTNGSC